MAPKKHCLPSRPQKCHKPEDWNDNGVWLRQKCPPCLKECIQQKNVLLKETDVFEKQYIVCVA